MRPLHFHYASSVLVASTLLTSGMISRRALLGGIGAAALLSSRGASAAPVLPKRFVVVHVPEGMWSGAERPAVGAATLGPILDPLDPYRARVTVLNNLSMKSRDHGPGGDGHHRGVPHMLTSTEMLDDSNAGGPSIDQRIAKAVGGASRVSLAPVRRPDRLERHQRVDDLVGARQPRTRDAGSLGGLQAHLLGRGADPKAEDRSAKERARPLARGDGRLARAPVGERPRAP